MVAKLKSTNGFSPVRKVSVVGEIIGQIKEMVRSNHFGRGSRLPSERELAKQLGVSRPSLREALRTLSLIGVLDTRHGSGTQISDSGAQVLKAPFEFLVMLEQPSIEDLFQSRELIEVHLAGRAAEQRTDDDLARIKAALEGMKGAVTNLARWMTAPDVAFHDAIAVAAHSPVLANVLICLNDGIRACVDASWRGHANGWIIYEMHEAVYKAIGRRDADAARQAMHRHMRLGTDAYRTYMSRRGAHRRLNSAATA